jgi:hypothetical protein
VSLRAPIAVTVEVRGETREGPRRVFRLAANLGEDGLRLERPAPFELGRPVELRFCMPEGGEPLRLDAEVRAADGDDEELGQGSELGFLAPDDDERRALRRYVIDRLGLPESIS